MRNTLMLIGLFLVSTLLLSTLLAEPLHSFGESLGFEVHGSAVVGISAVIVGLVLAVFISLKRKRGKK